MNAFRTWCLAVALVLAASPSASLQEHRHNTEDALKALFQALNLHDGSVVADVGAGPGNYSIPMARAVGPNGRVVAVDIEPRVLSRLRERAQKEGLGNVEAVQGDVDNPQLPPASVDGVLIVNAYHEMTSYPAMLKHIRAALKPAGRLVIADFASSSRRSQPRDVQTARHEIAPELVLGELRTAGFRIVTLEDPFMAAGHEDSNHVEWLVVATPAAPAAATDAVAPSTVISDLKSPELRITFEEFLPLYRAERVIVLDVREAVMFGRGHIPRARLAPMEALRDLAPQLTAANQQIVTYCDCPAEEASARAADYLRRRAVPDVKALLGGWEKWVASGEAIEK